MKNEITNYGSGIFDPLFDLFAPADYQANRYAKGLQMKTDIKENDKGYTFEIDLPGIDKQNINVSLKEGYLTIQAKVEDKHEENSQEKYIRKERFSGVSTRSYYVGDVDEKTISAKYADGVLKLFVPKEVPQAEKEHHIAIE